MLLSTHSKRENKDSASLYVTAIPMTTEVLTFAQGVWTVLCRVGALAAALRAAAGRDCWTCHLDGFMSNHRRQLFTLQCTEKDR